MTAEHRARDVEAVKVASLYYLNRESLDKIADLIAAARREGAEQGWDEGWRRRDGQYMGMDTVRTHARETNPYRADAIARGDQPVCVCPNCTGYPGGECHACHGIIPIARDDQPLPVHVCLIPGVEVTHDAHDWWYTSSGGGHQMSTPDDTERNVKGWHCPGIAGYDQPQGERCPGTLGTRPWWMSPDQYDPCRCDLPAGHAGDHQCEHTAKRGES